VAGRYKVRFDDPSGVHGTQFYAGKDSLAAADSISVIEGSTTSGTDAHLQSLGQISGVVTDAVTHGALQSIYVQVFDSSGSPVTGTTTGVDGSYTTTGLPSGNYTVEFFDMAGGYFSQFYSGETSASTADPVTVSLGATSTNISAALVPDGRISGTVADATNHAPLAGASVTVLDSTGATAGTASTNGNGAYTVAGLEPGSYTVEFQDTKAGYATQYYNAQDSAAAADPVVARLGRPTTGIDAALQPNGLTGIGGTVTDGKTSVALGGVTVTVYDSAAATVGTATTAADGTYAVTGLEPGPYRVEFADPSGKYVTQYFNGGTSLASATIVAVSQGNTTTADAAMSPNGLIAGTVSNAADNSAVAGINVDVLDATGAVVGSGATDAGGAYAIGGLEAGRYTVRFTDPAAHYLTQYNNSQSSSGQANPVAVTLGTPNTGIDAAMVEAATIAGTVTDASTHTPAAGIQVAVIDGKGDQVAGATTASAGGYSVTGSRRGATPFASPIRPTPTRRSTTAARRRRQRQRRCH